MGGEAFKRADGSHLTTSILKNEVGPTLDEFYKMLKGIGVSKFVPLGSTGKKEISGDIDVAIGPFSQEESKQKKAEIVSYLKSILGDERAKLLGQNIAVMFPIFGRSNEFVQIDLMLSSSPDDTGSLMAGTGEGVKGVYRNLMLSYIAKIRSAGDEKITISYPGGLQRSRGKDVVVPRTESIETIKKELDIVGIDVSTFETIVDGMNRDPRLSTLLPGFKEYIQRYIDDPKTSKDAQLAISFIESTIKEKLQEKHLRQIIRLILS